MQQPDDTWIVVADAGRSRFFKTDATLDAFEEFTANGGAASGVSGHGHGDHRDPHAKQEHASAKALAHTLDQAHLQHKFRDLVLVAAPSYLGMIKGELATGTGRAITATIHHDYANHPVNEIKSLVGKHLREKPLPR